MDCFASSRGSEREVWRAERGKDKDTMQIIAYGLQMSRSRWMGCSSTHRIVVSAKFCWLMGPACKAKTLAVRTVRLKLGIVSTAFISLS